MGTCAYSGLVQAAVWQKPTQHGKAVIFQLKILKTQAACCPILANPLVEKTRAPGGVAPQLQEVHLRREYAPSPLSRACLHPRGQRSPRGPRCRVHMPAWPGCLSMRATPSPCSVPHSCPLLSRCTQSTHTRKRLSLQLKAFFWIFSLVHISTVGSACDNIINILIPSWFFSRLPWRGKKHTIKLSKIQAMLKTRKIIPTIN